MRRQKIIFILFGLMCFISGFYLGKSVDIPFVRKTAKWSIGIYVGKDPFNLIPSPNISNPVLTANDVTDVSAEFVADPFMLRENDTWYMFFEVMNADTYQGDIGLAMSNDGFHWTYKQIVLDEPFHLSYPYVFKWKNEYYMIPETYKKKSIRLYKAIDFPKKWSFVKTLLTGKYYVDPTIFHHNGKWWIFTAIGRDDILLLYYSKNLTGPWTEHPNSPIILGNPNIARPGGRVIDFNGKIIRFAQDDYPTYGNQIRAFIIDVLTTTNYKEHEFDKNPILKPTGIGWNADGMHNIDPHQISQNYWIACVDGIQRSRLIFRWNK